MLQLCQHFESAGWNIIAGCDTTRVKSFAESLPIDGSSSRRA